MKEINNEKKCQMELQSKNQKNESTEKNKISLEMLDKILEIFVGSLEDTGYVQNLLEEFHKAMMDNLGRFNKAMMDNPENKEELIKKLKEEFMSLWYYVKESLKE